MTGAERLQILVHQSPGHKETRDTRFILFGAYTEEQHSFIKKFSGNGGSKAAKSFSPARPYQDSRSFCLTSPALLFR
jgi:hypothetical protein